MSDVLRRLLGFALLLLAPPAHAEAGAGLDLTWSAPAGCPEKTEVLLEIERLLGSDRAQKEGAPLRAIGEIRADAQRFRLELSFPSASSELTRHIESESCAELDEAAALILALSLDPNNPRLAAAQLPASVTAGASTAGAQPRTEPPAAPATAPPAPAAPAPAKRAEPVEPPESAPPAQDAPSARVRFDGPPQAGARAALDVGTLPAVAFGGALGFALAADPILLVTDLALFAPQTTMADGLDDVGGSFTFSALSVLPCWRLLGGRATLTPCGMVEAALIFASGQGVDQPEQPFTWFPRFGLGAEFGYALTSRIALGAGIFGHLSPARPRFVVQDIELFRPSLFGLRVSAGLEIAL
jgi:hypothetical protein